MSSHQLTASFGILVIGPAGSGKSTFCSALAQLYASLDRRCSLVNLDPGNEHAPYKPDIDIQELIRVGEVQTSLNLGSPYQT